MNIKILGWKSKGFRCPDAKVDLTNGKADHGLSFIQMPNGTGKTTTLELLKATLSGSATHWTENKIYQFRKKDFIVNRGEFIIHLQVDDAKLSIELIADFDSKEITYNTTSNIVGGRREGWSPPSQLIRFLNEEFIKLFIFDGELAEKLLDDDYSEASKAIDALFQLYYLEEIQYQAEEYWKLKTKDVSKKSSRSVNKKKRELEDLEERLKELENKYNSAKNELGKNEKRIEEIKTKISNKIAQVKEFREDYDKINSQLEEARREILSKSQECLQLLRNPASIHKKITGTLIQNKKSLDKLRLPSNTSKQFFVELANDDECICGRPIGEKESNAIKVKANKYLSNEIAGFLNSFKDQIATLETESFSQEALEDSRSELSKYLNKRDELNSKRRYISHQLQERGDDELRELEREKVNLERKNKDLGRLISKFESESGGDPFKSLSLSLIRGKIEKVENQISKITQTVDLKNKISTLKDILEDVYLHTKEDLKTKILNKFRDRVVQTLAYNPVAIESIEGSIKLDNKQEGASAGQTLSIAYCFLTTLLQWGTHSFPLVVDSPAGPLDNSVRRQIADIIPKLTDQFVAFVISSERPAFVDEIKRSAAKEIKSLTLLRKTDLTNKLINDFKPNIVDETKDGYVIDDEDFFNDFDLDEEQ